MRHGRLRRPGGDVVVGLLSGVAQDHFLFSHQFLVGAKVVGVDDRRISEPVGQRPSLEKHKRDRNDKLVPLKALMFNSAPKNWSRTDGKNCLRRNLKLRVSS